MPYLIPPHSLQRLEQMGKKMTATFHAVHKAAKQYNVNTRMGAYVVAMARVAEACKLRGWV